MYIYNFFFLCLIVSFFIWRVTHWFHRETFWGGAGAWRGCRRRPDSAESWLGGVWTYNMYTDDSHHPSILIWWSGIPAWAAAVAATIRKL